MTISNEDKKHLRRLGHKLNPVVTVAGKGLTDSVIAEIDRALNDHELIKVKLVMGDREAKQTAIATLVDTLGAEVIQTVGHIVLLLRRAKQPNRHLSNLLRSSFSGT
ncbi:ribosome assembly RNA-binding protein YhbY [Porticoccus sp.]|uniref:ribosome assembly RNA-binding protein YhbY n=1 Tax=Porticoccus sp. TaxID=2024853 RepID=UPI003F6A2D8D